MISRFNYTPVASRDSSNDDVFYKYELKEKIKVLSTNKDGSVKDYVKEQVWTKTKSSWKEFIASYDLGSVSKQVKDHLTKGTPLLTAHTLPAGDYTQLQKGAEIKKEMSEKGITLEMLIEAFNKANNSSVEVKPEVKAEFKPEGEAK